MTGDQFVASLRKASVMINESDTPHGGVIVMGSYGEIEKQGYFWGIKCPGNEESSRSATV